MTFLAEKQTDKVAQREGDGERSGGESQRKLGWLGEGRGDTEKQKYHTHTHCRCVYNLHVYCSKDIQQKVGLMSRMV